MPFVWREELQKRIDKKQQEIQEFRLKIRECEAYIQGLQETIKLLPKDIAGAPDVVLRPGTLLAKTRDVIKQAGKSLYINEILKSIGRPADKNNRVALSGSLSVYVKRGQIFTRPAPNTFGLLELSPNGKEPKLETEPPETFGVLECDEKDESEDFPSPK